MAEYIEREEAKEAVDYAIEMTSGERGTHRGSNGRSLFLLLLRGKN